MLARLALADRDYAYVNFDDERLAALTAGDPQRVQGGFGALWGAEGRGPARLGLALVVLRLQ